MLLNDYYANRKMEKEGVFMNIITIIEKNPIISLLVILCTIVPVLYNILKKVCGRKGKEIVYIKRSERLIQNGNTSIPDLTITFREKEIADLTSSRIAIWNHGENVINNSEIVAEQPLRVISKNDNTKILNVSLLTESDAANKIEIKNDESCSNKVEIGFDYMAKDDGLVIQVLHTGAGEDILVDCKIKGGEKVKNLEHSDEKRKHRTTKYYRRRLTLILVLFVLDVIGLCGCMVYQNYDKLGSVPDLAFMVAMILMPVICIVIVFKLLAQLYCSNVPSALRVEIREDN